MKGKDTHIVKKRNIFFGLIAVSVIFLAISFLNPVNRVTPRTCWIGSHSGPERVGTGINCVNVCIGFDSEGFFVDLDVRNGFENQSVVIENIQVIDRNDEIEMDCRANFRESIEPGWSEVFRLTDCAFSGINQFRLNYDGTSIYQFDMAVSYQVEGQETRIEKGWVEIELRDIEKEGKSSPCIKGPSYNLSDLISARGWG